MKNGIVIPCYNEETRLKLNEFQKFIDNNDDFTLCFVNDGSKDNTLHVLNQFRIGQEDRVMVCNMPKNSGKAEAVRSGVNALLYASEVENVGFVDADLATGFDDYKMLLNTLVKENKSSVVGSRKLNEDIEMERSLFRTIASYGFGEFINRIIGMEIKDTQCGAKIFNRDLANHIFRTEFNSRWLFDVEIFIRMKNYFGKTSVMNHIKEVALNKWEEIDGSKITLSESIKFPLELCHIAYDYNIKPQLQGINGVFTRVLRPEVASANAV